MKTKLAFLVCCLPVWLSAQMIDSIALRQVDSLIQVSRALSNKQEFDKALEVNAVAEKIAIEKFGKESAAYASCCLSLGRVLVNSGKMEEGIKWKLLALSIQEKTIGNEHVNCGKTKQEISYDYIELSQYEKAAVFALDAKNIVEKTEGKNSDLYFRCIVNLAICYASIDNLNDAEPLFLESRAITINTYGQDSEQYAINSSNLSYFYSLMGNYEKSLEYAMIATEVSRKLGDKVRSTYASSLGSLGVAYRRLGRLDKAEPLFLECLSIFEAIGEKDGRRYLEKKHDLAVLYSNLKQYPKALSLFEEILAAKEKKYGKENLSYASSANSLAVTYMDIGDFEKAEPILVSVIETIRNILGEESDYNVLELVDLSILYNATAQFEKAEALHLEIAHKHQFRMGKALQFLSEKETEEYLEKSAYFQDCALSLAQTAYHTKRTEVQLPRICYDNALYFKGFLLHAATRLRNISNADPSNVENINLLKSLARRLGDVYSEPKAERDSSLVHNLETQINDIEKELANSIAGYSEANRNVRWEDVQQHLGTNDAVIEFVHFDYYHKSAVLKSDSTFYAALVLVPGATQPQFIPLFEERQLTTLLKNSSKNQAEFLNKLYTNQSDKSLYELIWRPLEPALAQAKTVYFSPAGLLHRINFGAITTPIPVRGQGGHDVLADRYQLVELGSSRQLVIGSSQLVAGKQGGEASLFGGIKYEMDSTAIASTNESINTQLIAGRSRGIDFTNTDSTLRGGTWNYLGWTDVEVSTLETILPKAGVKPTTYKGYSATEENFKLLGQNQASPRVLHIATHGFFFPDPASNSNQSETAFKASEHPMIRSGLVLAGGNYAWEKGRPIQPGMEDGILTAYEISQMNLRNTELVVLSACETGLGDIQGNEGVYGLQRAFKIAGAKYLIMSLWQVPDYQTQQLMTSFYSLWLNEKRSIPDAFRSAQKAMREKYKDPFYWAGFVLVE